VYKIYYKLYNNNLSPTAGALLDSMADAVERSSVVLVCFTEKYKNSPNCRTG